MDDPATRAAKTLRAPRNQRAFFPNVMCIISRELQGMMMQQSGTGSNEKIERFSSASGQREKIPKNGLRIRNPKRMRNLAGKGRMQGNTSFPGCRWKDCVMLFFAFIPPHSSGPLFTFISSSNIFDYFGFLIRHAVLSIEHVDKKLKNRFFNVSGKREYPGFPHPALQRIFQCERRIKGEHAVGEWFLEQAFEVFPVFCLWTGAAHACLEGRGG